MNSSNKLWNIGLQVGVAALAAAEPDIGALCQAAMLICAVARFFAPPRAGVRREDGP